jgi:hypothetical protein
MLDVGDQVPDATVWFAPRETISLRDVVEDRPALFLFYLFDWSRSQWERRHLRLKLRASASIQVASPAIKRAAPTGSDTKPNAR